MIVVVADKIPPAVRGRMKLWFIEIKPNVFVSGVKDATAKEVISYLFESCYDDSQLVIIESTGTPPFYSICKKGSNLDYIKSISGFPLIFDKNNAGYMKDI